MMTLTNSNKLIRIGNYWRIGQPIYTVTDECKVRESKLTEIRISIVANDYMSTTFICTAEDTGIDLYFTWEDYEEGNFFVKKESAEQAAALAEMKRYAE